MPDLATQIDIKAPPDEVWAVLTDFAAYPEWNPFLRELRGEAVEGCSLSLCIRSKRGDERQFWARILKFRAPAHLCWQAELIGGGLLRGECGFALQVCNGGTRVDQVVRFSGPLAALVRGNMAQEVHASAEAMGQALRARVEEVR